MALIICSCCHIGQIIQIILVNRSHVGIGIFKQIDLLAGFQCSHHDGLDITALPLDIDGGSGLLGKSIRRFLKHLSLRLGIVPHGPVCKLYTAVVRRSRRITSRLRRGFRSGFLRRPGGSLCRRFRACRRSLRGCRVRTGRAAAAGNHCCRHDSRQQDADNFLLHIFSSFSMYHGW